MALTRSGSRMDRQMHPENNVDGEAPHQQLAVDMAWSQKKRKRLTSSGEDSAKKLIRNKRKTDVPAAKPVGGGSTSGNLAPRTAEETKSENPESSPLVPSDSNVARSVDTTQTTSDSPDPPESLGECGTPEKPKPKSGRKKQISQDRKRNLKPKTAQSPPASVEPPAEWRRVWDLVLELRKERDAPVDWAGSEALGVDESTQETNNFHVLVALMLSSQTKDQVVADAMYKLKARGLTVQSIIDMPPEELDSIIAKVGFHNNKTKYIKQTAQLLLDRHNGVVPATAEELCALPGIGPKMAYIILAVAHGIVSGIGVDTHMHRLFNLLGWVQSKTPEQTRKQLEGWLPRELWGEVNVLFVGFGQMLQQPAERVKLLRRAIASQNAAASLQLISFLGGDVHTLLDKEGKQTPLMLAAETGAAAAAKALMDLGAKADARNAQQQTAADIAVQSGHSEVATMLNSAPSKQE